MEIFGHTVHAVGYNQRSVAFVKQTRTESGSTNLSLIPVSGDVITERRRQLKVCSQHMNETELN